MMSLHMLMMDAMEAQAMLSLQSSLRSVGSLLALHPLPLPDDQYGFCVAAQTGKGVTLQMLLRPQPFDLRQWHSALKKLPCTSVAASADHAKTAKAMRALVEFMATDQALAGLAKSLTIYGQAFNSVGVYTSVLQYAADKCIQIHFVAIAANGLDGEPAANEMDLASFATGLADFDSASAVYCPCDPFAIHQACLQWAHSILNPHPVTVSLHFPSMAPQAATSPASAQSSALLLPGVQSHPQQGPSEQPLPDQASAPDKPRHKPIVCRVVSEVTHMSPVLTHPLVCACHGKQVQQQQQQVCADVMQQSQATCSVSGRPLTPAQMKSNDSMVQVGHSGVLTLPSAQAAALKPPDILPSPGKDACLDAAPFEIVKRLKMESVSESLMFGWPHILVPYADSFDSMSEMRGNEQSLLALCQMLEGHHEVLLLRGCTDLDTTKVTTWPLHYVARPARNGTMLVRRVAIGEELLPVDHLLPGQVSEVPSHIRQPLQEALQCVPLSDYSPLDHHSGAFNKLAGLVSQSLSRSSTPLHARPTPAPGKTASTVPDRQAVPSAPVKQTYAPAKVPQAAVMNSTAPKAQLAATKAAIQLPPAPSFSFVDRKPLQPSQQNMQPCKPSGLAPKPVLGPMHMQAQPQPVLTKQTEPAEQPRHDAQTVKERAAPSGAQAGPRLNFKRIRTLK